MGVGRNNIMKIVMINGTMRKESTYHIGKQLISKLEKEENEVIEFFLPKDLPKFCVGCAQCFMKSETLCPHYEYTKVISDAIEKADILVFASPVYVYHTSGQMKTLLDHFGHQWMVHRPKASMFQKQAVLISTAAGGGMKSANKDIKDSMNFWGVGRTYTYGIGVGAIAWKDVSEKKKEKIAKDIAVIANKVKKNAHRVKPSFKVKANFYIMRQIHKKIGFSAIDVAHWKDQGWLDKSRPWK